MSNASPQAGTTPVFRSITVAVDVTITLGQPLSAQAMALMDQLGPQRYQMKNGTFKRAAQIDVQLGVGAIVHQMDFTYDPGTDYADLLTDFVAEIGQPTRQQGNVVTWQDPNTQFQLVNGGPNIRSTLLDLGLTGA
jgi:hypothetical protein